MPAGALAIAGGVIAATLIPSAQASPSLPAKTPAQLLASVAAQTHVPAFTGSVLETTSLGLPQLPGSNDQTSLIALLTGSHTVNVWFASPQNYRLSLPGKMSESDLYRDGQTAWLWQSVPDTVTKLLLGSQDTSGQAPMPLPVTPQQAAADILAAVGPTTTVSVASNVYVAGQASYELVLAPKDARSLIGQVRIAVDAANGLPLRVEVIAKNASSPAITIGFTSITFGAPSPSDLTFTPPKGAKVSTVDLSHGGSGGSSDGADVIGSGWLSVLKLPASTLTDAAGAPAGNENPVNGGDDAAALQAVLGSATTVQGAFGSGQLIKTSLVNVLITGGSMYVGAVEPSVLYAAATPH